MAHALHAAWLRAVATRRGSATVAAARLAEAVAAVRGHNLVWTRVRVPGDGNCMFHAIGLALQPPLSGAAVRDCMLQALLAGVPRRADATLPGGANFWLTLEHSYEGTRAMPTSPRAVHASHSPQPTHAIRAEDGDAAVLDAMLDVYVRHMRQRNKPYGGGMELLLLHVMLRRPVVVYMLQSKPPPVRYGIGAFADTHAAAASRAHDGDDDTDDKHHDAPPSIWIVEGANNNGYEDEEDAGMRGMRDARPVLTLDSVQHGAHAAPPVYLLWDGTHDHYDALVPPSPATPTTTPHTASPPAAKRRRVDADDQPSKPKPHAVADIDNAEAATCSIPVDSLRFADVETICAVIQEHAHRKPQWGAGLQLLLPSVSLDVLRRIIRDTSRLLHWTQRERSS